MSFSTTTTTTTRKPPRERTKAVFSNAEVRLGNLDVVGFDYDFTLVSYTHAVQNLVYEKAKNFLCNELSYPAELSASKFDSSFCIRGLVFDRKNGTLLKLNSRQMITPGSVFKGRKRLRHPEVLATYNQSLHMSQRHIKSYCRPLEDQFSLAQGCLISDVIQLAEDLNINYDPYWLHADVLRAINFAHGAGGMHAEIIKDVAKYIHPSPKLPIFLQRQAEAGQKLFLLTNSPFNFVNAGMNFLCGNEWMKMFDICMFEASKPSFFRSKKKFRSLDSSNQFSKWGVVSDYEVSNHRPLVGGSVSEMMRLTGWQGKQFMYWGDHVFADLAEPSRESGWATGAIVRELHDEIKTLNSDEYLQLASVGKEIEVEMLSCGGSGGGGGGGGGGGERRRSSESPTFDDLEKRRNANFKSKSMLFNPNFGSIFSSRGQSSSFGGNVLRVTDLYTSKLENLMDYPTDHRFFPKRLEHMPHDVVG